MGIWIVYGYDTMPYPIAVFAEDDELHARRFQDNIGYPTQIKFWEFGVEWSNSG